MSLGALVAALGALFLGEYEFDELLPILSGALLGLIVAEVVVSVGRLRTLPLAITVAAWSATAVVLAGYLDSNETEPIKVGAYLSAGLAAMAALARANDWRRTRADATVGPESERDDARTSDDGEEEWVDDWAHESRASDQRHRDDEEDDWPAIPSAPVPTRSRTARRIDSGRPQQPSSQRESSSESPWQRPDEPAADRGRVRATARPRRRSDRGR